MSACHHNFSWFIGLLAVGFGAETMLMVWHHPPFRSSFFFLLLATTWTVENRKIHCSNSSGQRCTVEETCLKMLQNFLCHYSSRSLVMNSLMYHFHTIRICKNNSNAGCNWMDTLYSICIIGGILLKKHHFFRFDQNL